MYGKQTVGQCSGHLRCAGSGEEPCVTNIQGAPFTMPFDF